MNKDVLNKIFEYVPKEVYLCNFYTSFNGHPETHSETKCFSTLSKAKDSVKETVSNFIEKYNCNKMINLNFRELDEEDLVEKRLINVGAASNGLYTFGLYFSIKKMCVDYNFFLLFLGR